MDILLGLFLPEWTIYGVVIYIFMGLFRMFLIFVLGFTLKNKGVSKIIQVPIFIYGFLYDIFLNWCLTFLTFDAPNEWDETMTNRMKRYKATDTGWKGKFSFWMCKQLNRHDKGHC